MSAGNYNNRNRMQEKDMIEHIRQQITQIRVIDAHDIPVVDISSSA